MLAFDAAVDLGVLVLLGLFGLWGAVHGSLRMIATLLVLLAAFPLAGLYGPRIESSVVKAVSATGTDREAVAWSVVFAGVLVAGGVLLALLQPLFKRLRARGAAGWTAAGLLGMVHGAVVLTIFGYALLMAFDDRARPAWVHAVERSASSRGMRLVGRGLREVIPLPEWLLERTEAVDRRLDEAQGAGAAARRRERETIDGA